MVDNDLIHRTFTALESRPELFREGIKERRRPIIKVGQEAIGGREIELDVNQPFVPLTLLLTEITSKPAPEVLIVLTHDRQKQEDSRGMQKSRLASLALLSPAHAGRERPFLVDESGRKLLKSKSCRGY